MHPKAVSLTLGETDYTLFYDLNALCVLREHQVDAFSLTAEQLTDPRVIRALLWAGLQKYHAGLSQSDVGALIELCDLGDAALAFTDALKKATTKEVRGPQ